MPLAAVHPVLYLSELPNSSCRGMQNDFVGGLSFENTVHEQAALLKSETLAKGKTR